MNLILLIKKDDILTRRYFDLSLFQSVTHAKVSMRRLPC